LELIVDRVPTLPILLIITFRPEFTPPWIGRSQVNLVSLNRLPPRQRAEMIERVTGGKALPRQVVAEIVDRTDGVPLFVEELTKAVVESSMLTDAGDRYTLAGTLPSLAIPTTLHASLMARLDRLASVREVAQIGAALGRQFSHELISAVAPMPRRQLDDALEQLVGAGLIYRRGAPPDAEYTFKHALVQDAAYSTLLRSRRQQLHGRIATTLEDQFSEIVAAQPALLAWHCTEAGLVEKAIGYRLSAGQQGLARSAMTEAVAQLRSGLALLTGLPDGAGRQQRELDFQIALGGALTATQGYGAPVVSEAYDQARRLCEQLGQPARLVPVLHAQWVQHLMRAEHGRAHQCAKQVLDLGEAQNDLALKALGCRCNAASCLWLGEPAAARAYVEQGLGLYDPAHRPSIAGLHEDNHNILLVYRSLALFSLGYLNQARVRRDEALADARRRGHAHTLALALAVIWFVDWGTEPPQASLQRADELVALSDEHDFPMWQAIGTAWRGWCLAALGQAEEGIPLLTQGLVAYRMTGANRGSPFALALLADAFGGARQPGEGLKRLIEADRLVEATEERWAEAEMLRVRGKLLNSIQEYAAAEDSFREAIVVAQRQSAKLWELRAATSLARLWRDQGRDDEARDLLAPVHGWFTEGFDTADLKEAKALLDALSEAPK
jgi:predicted ATPase